MDPYFVSEAFVQPDFLAPRLILGNYVDIAGFGESIQLNCRLTDICDTNLVFTFLMALEIERLSIDFAQQSKQI